MKLKEMLEASKLKNNILKIVLAVLFMSVFNSLSYAYFTSEIEGKGNEMVLSTSDISIKFTDSEAIKKTGLAPGSTITKTFTITNNSDSSASYKINWEYLINNFVGRENLVYEISSNNGGGILSETQLPDSEEHINILDNLTINKDVTQNYTMTITYKDNGQNQDLDKNKSLIGKLEVTDLDGNSILPETSTGSSSSVITSEKSLYGLKMKDLVNTIYPVGIVVEFGSDVDPNDIDTFAGTKWERYAEGQVSVGYKSGDTNFGTIGKTGGSKTIDLSHSHTVNAHTHTTKDHTLTTSEMPSHGNHLFQGKMYSQISSYYDFADTPTTGKTYYLKIDSMASATTSSVNRGWKNWNGGEFYPTGKLVGEGNAHNHGETTESSPDTNSKLSSTQSVLNPYIVSSKWKRVS